MASLTRWLVASLIRGLLFRTRDTVDWETPASRAMSQLLGLRLGSSLAIGRLLIPFPAGPRTLVVGIATRPRELCIWTPGFRPVQGARPCREGLRRRATFMRCSGICAGPDLCIGNTKNKPRVNSGSTGHVCHVLTDPSPVRPTLGPAASS